MTVTEKYVAAIFEATGRKSRPTRLVEMHKLLDGYFAERLKEYVESRNLVCASPIAPVEKSDA